MFFSHLLTPFPVFYLLSLSPLPYIQLPPLIPPLFPFTPIEPSPTFLSFLFNVWF